MKAVPSPLRTFLGLAFLSAAGAASVHAASSRPAPRVIAQASPAPAASDSASTLRPVERSFIVDATDGGRLTAEVSRLAVSQARTSSVRNFAQQLVTDYSQINSSLESLARRKGLELPLQPTSFADQTRDLAAKPGSEFDRAFIRRTAAMCQHELELCETAIAEAKDGDVRDLAGSLLPVLRDHVNKTKELQKSL